MYSRLLRSEVKKNRRKAIVFSVLTLLLLAFILIYGFTAFSKFTSFLANLQKDSEKIEQSDNTPPSPARFDSLPKSTNKDELEVRGTSEPGSTVILTLNKTAKDTLVNSEGKFFFVVILVEGENKLQILSKDKSGNQSQESNRQIVVLDKKPPLLELTKPQDGSEFYGSRQRQIVIEGKTEEDGEVTINETFVVVEPNSTFSFATTLNEGQNSFKVKVQDEAGNITEKTISVSYIP